MKKLILSLMFLSAPALAVVGSSVQPIVAPSQVLFGSPVKTITSTGTVTISTITGALSVQNIIINGTCTGSGCGSSGGGGSSSLAVFNGSTKISSSTISIAGDGVTVNAYAIGTSSAGFQSIPSSVTLQGNTISLLALAQSTATLSVSTASLQTQINGLGTTYLTTSSAPVTYAYNSLYASATSSGVLKAQDWQTFNTKGSGTITQVIAGQGLTGGGSSGAVTVNASAVSLSTQTVGTLSLTTQAGGTLQSGQFPALTGDITTSAGSLATTAAATQSHITNIPSGLTLGSANNAVLVASNTILAGATFYGNTQVNIGGTQQIYLSTLTSVTAYYTGINTTFNNYNSSGTITPDATQGNVISMILHSSATINIPVNAQDGMPFTYRFIQDAAGSRSIYLGSGFHFGVDISTWVASTTASKTDYLSCRYNTANGSCDMGNGPDRGF